MTASCLLFPTMVIGSLPRPQWVIDLVDLREQGRLEEDEFQKTIQPALGFAIALQEAAGIDIITDGEWRRLAYFTGFSQAVAGFEPDVIKVKVLTGATQTRPAVVSKLEYRRPIALEEVRFAMGRTHCRIKATLPSPYMIDRWFYDPERSREAYPRREDLVEDAAWVLRQEVLALKQAGVSFIQFDDAMMGRFVGQEYNPSGTNPKVRISMADRERELEMAVWGLNLVVEGFDGITTALHVCRGHRARMHVTQGGFEPLMPHLYRAKVDVLALELAAEDAGTVEVLKGFPEDKILGLGVIDVLSPDVDTPEVLISRAEAALRYLDPERLILNPDCGFAPTHDNPISLDEAYLKLKSVSQAARQLRARSP